MKYIKNVGTIDLVDVRGKPFPKTACRYCLKGEESEQAQTTHAEVLLDMLPVAMAKKDAKVMLQCVELQKAIRQGEHEDYFSFEDAHHEVLKGALEGPEAFNSLTAMNFAVVVLAHKDAKDKPPSLAEVVRDPTKPADNNGAEAVAS